MKTLEARILLSGRDSSGQAFDSAARQALKLKGTMESVARGLRTTGLALTAGITLPVLALGKASIDQWRQDRAALAQLDAAITASGGRARVSSGEMKELAESLSDKSLYEANKIIGDVSANLLRFANIRGDVLKQANIAAVELAAGKHIDLAAASETVGRALNNPLNAGRALMRMHIALTKAQENWIKMMIQSGQKGAGTRVQMFLLNKVMDTWRGSAEKAAAADPIGRMTVQWAKLKGEIGTVIGGPLATLLAGAVRVMKVFQALPEPMKRMIVMGALIAAALGPVMFILGLSISGFIKLAGFAWGASKAIIAVARAARGLMAVRAVAASAEFGMLQLKLASAGAAGAVETVATAGMWAALRAQIIATAVSIGTLTVAALPWLAIALAVAGVAFIIWKNWKPISALFKGMWAQVKASEGWKAFTASIRQLGSAFRSLNEALRPIWDSIKGVWHWLNKLIDDQLLKTFGIDLKTVRPIVDGVSAGLKGISFLIRAIAFEIEHAARAIKAATEAYRAFTSSGGDLSKIPAILKGEKPKPSPVRPPAENKVKYWDWSWFGLGAAPPVKNLKDLIGRGEGKYNQVNLGARGGYRAADRDLAAMTVAQVMAAQSRREFNAAGKYEVIRSTLRQAFSALHLTGREKFDAKLQDRIFSEFLIKSKRPEIGAYLSGRSNNLMAALQGAAKEWASVANPLTGKSYYGGPNKASISAFELAAMLKRERAAIHASAAATHKVDIGKGSLDVTLRHDGTVKRIKSKSPANVSLNTGVDSTGTWGGG